MSNTYKAVLWNRQKKRYDLFMMSAVISYLLLFTGITLLTNPEVTVETLVIRSTSTLALLMLHVILAIGPLTRLNPAFLPLLYNRRHLGVAMFCISAIHGIFSVLQFHSQGDVNPVVSVFTSNVHYGSISRFPFQVFGFFALLILFLMAITSHDFWLHNLTPKIWKRLHMMVYVAYAMILVHVMFGALQYETTIVYPALLLVGFIIVAGLHLFAAFREKKIDDNQNVSSEDGYIKVCHVNDMRENRAMIVCAGGERIAIFRYGNKVSAVSNVCKHQNGPLGEGRIVDGCITCPWHGYQYLPHNGVSPPPFSERVATYDVKINLGQVWVNPNPYPEGTERTPALISDADTKRIRP